MIFFKKKNKNLLPSTMKAKLNNPTFHKPINECQHLAAYNFKSLPGNMIINQTCEHLILPLWTNTKEKKTLFVAMLYNLVKLLEVICWPPF